MVLTASVAQEPNHRIGYRLAGVSQRINALGVYLAKQAAQSRAACSSVRKSAYVRDPLLGRRFQCGNRLRRQLEHYRFLTLKHLSQQQGLPVRKF
jgi:hypothetical protein